MVVVSTTFPDVVDSKGIAVVEAVPLTDVASEAVAGVVAPPMVVVVCPALVEVVVSPVTLGPVELLGLTTVVVSAGMSVVVVEPTGLETVVDFCALLPVVVPTGFTVVVDFTSRRQ